MTLLIVGITILFTYWQRSLFNSLESKDWSAFISLLISWHVHPEEGLTIGFTPLLIAHVLCTVYSLYLKQSLQIQWRSWMTDYCQSLWLKDRTYFRMHLTNNKEADNPDQRIAEDINLFVEKSLTLGFGLLQTTVSMLSFLVLLWALSREVTFFGQTVSGSLVWIAILYAGVGTATTHWIGRRLIKLNFTQQQVEANFRFSLIRFRENAESIAFYRGEGEERRRFKGLFDQLRKNWCLIIIATKRVMLFSASFSQATLVFPLAVAAPAYFAGAIPLGGVFQTANALNKVIENMSWFVENYIELATYSATVERLYRFIKNINITNTNLRGPNIVARRDNGLRCRDLCVYLPNNNTLLENVTLSVEPGEAVVLKGQSGAGKSSLLKTFAGLWPFANGEIELPNGLCMFVPQKPYIPSGNLQQVLLYPSQFHAPDSIKTMEALELTGLQHLAGKNDQEILWHHQLSGGEAQRLTLARLLLLKPTSIFLDEATSNLDESWEIEYYRLLRDHLQHTTIISVAHRPGVLEFHDRELRLLDKKIVL